MMKWITAFFMAWGMFWIVPCPAKLWDQDGHGRMLLCFPLIGMLAGAVWAVLAWLRSMFLPGLFGAALLTIIPHFLTGFIHMDGYMDCADAVCSRREREERLKILKDPHVGTFAVVFLVVLLLLEFSLFAQNLLSDRWYMLIFVMGVPRCCTACAILTLKPLEHSSYAHMFANGVPTCYRAAAYILLGILLVLPIVISGTVGLFAAIGAVGSWLTMAYICHDFGGISGDVSGAAVTVGELVGLAALVLL